MDSTLKSEWTVLRRLAELTCVARVLDHGIENITVNNDALGLPFLVQEYILGKTLEKYITSKFPNGVRKEADWFHFALELTRQLIAVHQCEVIHRDIWPPNVIVRKNREISYIDFGEAAFRHAEAKHTRPSIHSHPYLAPERKHDWLWPSRRGDIYSLGGIFYFIATGQDPDFLPVEDVESLKEKVVNGMQKKNESLLAANWGIADIIARCLRFKPSGRIRDADFLLEEIQLFVDPRGRTSPNNELTPGKTIIKLAANDLIANPDPLLSNPLFKNIAGAAFVKFQHRLESMCNGVFDISGDHEDLVSGMTAYLSVLDKGDKYLAISIPAFWDAENLGIRGRFLSMNRQIAKRGVEILRLFLVTEKELNDPDSLFAKIADVHRKLGGDTRYKVVTEDERNRAIRNDEHYGVWIQKKRAMKIIPVYEKGVITLVRVRGYDGGPTELEKRLRAEIMQGKPLT